MASWDVPGAARQTSPPASRVRRVLPNLLLLVGAVGLTLLAFEGVARLSRGIAGKEQDERDRYTEYDPHLGWRKTPGAHVLYSRREYETEVQINRLGLRDRERTYQAAPGSFRILALGDSYIEAYSVPLADSVTQVLERMLNRPGCPIEVINGGTTGYSTDQEYLFYHLEGVRYSPKVVVVFFHYNDVLYNGLSHYYRLPKPLLESSEDGVVLSNYPVPRLPRPPPASRRPRRQPRGSLAWYWLKDRVMVGAPRTFNALGHLGLWDPLGGDGVADEFLVFRRRRPLEIQAGWRMTDRILASLAREVAGRGGRLLVAYVPSIMEVSDRAWYLSQQRYDLRPELWDPGLALRRLEKSAADGGFPLLDLTPALHRHDHGLLGEPYYVRDGHWNSVGHRVAAEELRRFLFEQGWLPPCTTRQATR